MKNKKNTVIVSFVINIIIFIVLLSLILLYFYPEVMKIEKTKEDIKTYKENYNEIITKWLKYTDFKKIKNISLNNYERMILSKISVNFYNENFINNGKFKTYEEFLSDLDSKIKWDLKESYNEKHDKIYNIMPIYVDNYIGLPENKGTISDFKFVNLVENLLHNYNLTTTSAIWIINIEKVKEYSNTKTNSDLWSDIYKITLPLKIEGKKKNIVKFMKGINEMWKVHKEDINWVKELVIDDNDNFIELEKIKMDEYIDSSPSVSPDEKEKWLIELLETSDQKNEIFPLEVKLLFYVQWLPNFKIKQEVLKVLWPIKIQWQKNNKIKIEKDNYNAIKARLQKIKLENKDDKLVLRQLNEIDIYLKGISSKVKAILKDIATWKNLLESFSKAEKYKSIFHTISTKLDTYDKIKNNN